MTTERKQLGRYIVADPKICHGRLTFIGTRIFVRDVLDMVARDLDWDETIRQWHGSITREAIAEAVQCAGTGFISRSVEIVSPN